MDGKPIPAKLASQPSALHNYLPPLFVLGIIIGAIWLDYAFRNTAGNFYDRGYANLYTGKTEAAIADFSRALRQNSSDPAARFGLGWAYHQRGWLDEALNQYAIAGPKSLETAHFAYHNAGVIYFGKGDLDHAEEAYLKSLQANPLAKNSLTTLSAIYTAKNQYDRLLQAYQKYLTASPNDADILYQAGATAEKLNQRQLAVQYYRAALAADPNSAPARDRLRQLSAQ